MFDDVAGSKDSDVGPYAAQLSLESLSVLGIQLHRPACIDVLGERAKQYYDSYCGPPMRPGNQEMCRTLEGIPRDVERHRDSANRAN